MRNLEDFELPNDGEITVCEINGRMQSMSQDYANLTAFTTCVESHPKIHITRDLLHPTTSGDEGKALFLPVDMPFLKQLTQVYYEQGLIEALNTCAGHNLFIISKGATIFLLCMKYVQKIRLSLNPSLRDSASNLINQLAQTRNWNANTVRLISWHPYCNKLAVATCDDSIRIYSGDTSFTPLLRCKQQKNITCIAWRPMSNTEIAVGHENGIIIWNVDPNSMVARPSISNAIILQRSCHTPIMSIAWSPRGDLLVSAAAYDKSVLVWDVDLDRTSMLKRSGSTGNVLVKWSPAGDKLFTSTTGLIFRVWNCQNWECDRWTVLSGRVQTACWIHCGTYLLFATNTETVIYGLIVKNDVIFTSDVDTASSQAIPMFDVTKVDFDGIMVGGLIQFMDVDPKGNHLAVIFQDTNAVAVFNIIRQQGIQLCASSLVVGLTEERPSVIGFQQNFEAGACLTIGWSSGRVQYYPIIYTDLTNNLNVSQSMNKSLYGSFNSPVF